MAKQSKLSAQQHSLLEAAASRADGVVTIPAKMPKATATKLIASLMIRKLLRAIRSRQGMPIWRDVAGKSNSLVIARAGRAAIGAAFEKAQSNKAKRPNRNIADSVKSIKAPRAGSKQALVIDMLAKEQGATLAAMVKETGWLPHTTRAALTGLRKKGFGVERFRVEDGGPSVYRIVPAANQAARA